MRIVSEGVVYSHSRWNGMLVPYLHRVGTWFFALAHSVRVIENLRTESEVVGAVSDAAVVNVQERFNGSALRHELVQKRAEADARRHSFHVVIQLLQKAFRPVSVLCPILLAPPATVGATISGIATTADVYSFYNALQHFGSYYRNEDWVQCLREKDRHGY